MAVGYAEAREPYEYLTRAEAAKLLRRPVRTLDSWAYNGVGPVYYRVRGRALYRKADLEAFFEACRVESKGGSR